MQNRDVSGVATPRKSSRTFCQRANDGAYCSGCRAVEKLADERGHRCHLSGATLTVPLSYQSPAATFLRVVDDGKSCGALHLRPLIHSGTHTCRQIVTNFAITFFFNVSSISFVRPFSHNSIVHFLLFCLFHNVGNLFFHRLMNLLKVEKKRRKKISVTFLQFFLRERRVLFLVFFSRVYLHC